jgi:anti-anti-sigma regulatory factor
MPAMTNPPVTVKRLPQPHDQRSHRVFLREIKQFVDRSQRPRLIVDLSSVEQIHPESIDLLLECVDHAERGDGEVSVVGASVETAVILELTQVTSVLNMLPCTSEATVVHQVRESESAQPAA